MTNHASWESYLEFYLEETHDGEYGCALEIDPENQIAEASISHTLESEKPCLDGIINQLMREAQITDADKNEETTNTTYYLQIKQSDKLVSDVYVPDNASNQENHHT